MIAQLAAIFITQPHFQKISQRISGPLDELLWQAKQSFDSRGFDILTAEEVEVNSHSLLLIDTNYRNINYWLHVLVLWPKKNSSWNRYLNKPPTNLMLLTLVSNLHKKNTGKSVIGPTRHGEKIISSTGRRLGIVLRWTIDISSTKQF